MSISFQLEKFCDDFLSAEPFAIITDLRGLHSIYKKITAHGRFLKRLHLDAKYQRQLISQHRLSTHPWSSYRDKIDSRKRTENYLCHLVILSKSPKKKHY